MSADIAGHLSTSCRVTNMDCVLQVEGFNEFCQVIGIGVHLVSVPGLARSTMTAAIMCDAAVSLSTQKNHLVFPGIRGKRPTMTEDYRLSRTPILIVDLSTVFCSNRRSGGSLFLVSHKNLLLCTVNVSVVELIIFSFVNLNPHYEGFKSRNHH